MRRITQADVAEAASDLKERRIAEGKRTWMVVEYYNGWCHLHEVDADTEARHCSLRHVAAGTKREMHDWLTAAMY